MGNELAGWSRLNQSLYVVTFITQGDWDKSKSCVLCLESNHTEEQCTLYSSPMKPQSRLGRWEWIVVHVTPSPRARGRAPASWRASPGIRAIVVCLRASIGTFASDAPVTTASPSAPGCILIGR